MKERIVLLGPPASGKGTQAELLEAKFRLPIASPGAMLREERRQGTALGQAADAITREGRLLPDAMILEVMKAWLATYDPRFILDGIPRSVGQADGLGQMLEQRGTPLQAAVALEAPEEVLFARLASRMMCQQCGRIVAVGWQVTHPTDACPNCGGTLGRRTDDTPEILHTRLEEYHAKTAPLLDYYETKGLLTRVDSAREAGEVFRDVLKALENPA